MNENLNQSDSREAAQKNRNRSIIFLITTLVFLGTTIYLAADNTNKSKMNRSLNTEMVESTNRYADLDAKYSEALIEIESYKGKSAELDSILSVKEKDITALRANLNKEKKSRQLSESEYQKQLSDINTVIADLNTKIEALQRENGILIVQKDSLGRNLTETQTQVTELQSTNSVLTQKVTVASLLIPQNIVVEGTRSKSSGKESETNSAKKAEQLKVCFDVPENKVAEVGSKMFHVRVIGPSGSTLSVQEQGSGVLTAVETGEQISYTTTATANYQQQRQNVCTNWSQSTGFQPGKYTAEIYQDGYLVGKQELELK